MRRVFILAALVALDAAGYVGLTLTHARKDQVAFPAGTAGRAAAAVAVAVEPVAVYPPGGGEAAVSGDSGMGARGFIIYFSDADGWTDDADRTAGGLAARGFTVAAVDSRAFLAALEAAPDACVHPVQPLVNLATEAEGDLGWRDYRHPVLAGHGLGGTLAYATLAQAVPGIFAAGVSTGFADVLPGKKRWCSLNGYSAVRARGAVAGWRPGPAASLPTPWRALDLDDGDIDPAVAAILAGSPDARLVTAPSEAEGIAAAIAPILAARRAAAPRPVTQPRTAT